MSPSGKQRHRNKKRVLAFSPRCELFPLLTTQTPQTDLKDELAGELIPCSVHRRARLPAPLLTPHSSALTCEATGAALKSHCGSPLYAEGRTHRDPSPSQGL